MTCPHEETEPITLPVTFQEIGKMCTTCFEALPSWWGCVDCVHDVSMTLGGDRYPFLVEPCHAHYNPHC